MRLLAAVLSLPPSSRHLAPFHPSIREGLFGLRWTRSAAIHTSTGMANAHVVSPAKSDHQTLAVAEEDDDPHVRSKYRPFLLDDETTATDWVSQLELETVEKLVKQDLHQTGTRLKILVLFGSLRRR